MSTQQNPYWQMEPEISSERQAYLEQRLAILPDPVHGIYPFGGIALTRADIEWLLIHHDNNRGPIDWQDVTQRQRTGLDLRGADLRQTNLFALPLAKSLLGFVEEAAKPIPSSLMEAVASALTDVVEKVQEGWSYPPPPSQEAAAGALLENAQMSGVHLEGATLNYAKLNGSLLAMASLTEAQCHFAHFEHVIGGDMHFEQANLRDAIFDHAYLNLSHFEGARLESASLRHADVNQSHFEFARLNAAHCESANMVYTRLSGALLNNTHLEGANLVGAYLGALYMEDEEYEHLQNLQLRDFIPRQLFAANLQSAFFDDTTELSEETIFGDRTLGMGVSVADVHWRGANLAVIDWSFVRYLGDEMTARIPSTIFVEPSDSQIKDVYGMLGIDMDQFMQSREMRAKWYQTAARAYRQLGVALREQGVNEVADVFAYRAQICLRRAHRLQRHFGRALWSGFLDLLSGYGYRPLRSFFAYLLLIGGFSFAYYFLAPDSHIALSPLSAFVFSMTSFHGRGFFPGGIPLDDPLTVLAAFEAFFGLIVELSFIATFTQRYFAK
jgi:uncharacterized protein YjbI with pentapeptide repeats